MKVYYDDDANLSFIKDKTIAVIGYGIQGRAQALNMRDSGLNVVVGNRKDPYRKQAIEDRFQVFDIDEAAKKGDVIFLLIPDEAQGVIYERQIRQHLKDGDVLVFAHGYSIRFKKIVPPKDIDLLLIAPRMPGKQIRGYYLNGTGVPAFIDVRQDYSGKGLKICLALCKAIGFTRTAAMMVTFDEETELDLFVEHYVLPMIIRTIRLSFDVLVKEGYQPEAALMELYASGEIGELLMEAARIGIYDVWQKNASPTCQYGIKHYSKRVLPDSDEKKIRQIIKEIKNGTFALALDKEGAANYKSLKEYDQENRSSKLTHTQETLASMIKKQQVDNDSPRGRGGK